LVSKHLTFDVEILKTMMAPPQVTVAVQLMALIQTRPRPRPKQKIETTPKARARVLLNCTEDMGSNRRQPLLGG
jgi:hypothetical protein